MRQTSATAGLTLQLLLRAQCSDFRQDIFDRATRVATRLQLTASIVTCRSVAVDIKAVSTCLLVRGKNITQRPANVCRTSYGAYTQKVEIMPSQTVTYKLVSLFYWTKRLSK